MSRIARVVSLPHLDSQGDFTVKVTIELESGTRGWGAVPKGASALKLKRLGKAIEEQELEEKSLEEQVNPEATLVEQWVANFERDVAPKLVGLEVGDQLSIDEVLLDYNTRDYWRMYGVNVMLAASIAVARAAARDQGVELFEYVAHLSGDWPVSSVPMPMVTVIEGGYRIANDLDFQAIMLVPIGALSVDESHRMIDAVVFKIRNIMENHEPPLNTSVGEQGGYVPKFGPLGKRAGNGWQDITVRALDLVNQAICDCGFSLGEDFCLALDCAMTAQDYDPGTSNYTFRKYARSLHYPTRDDEDPVVSTEELIEFYEKISKSHAVWSIEDGLDRSDEIGWRLLSQKLGSKMQLVGDDLFYDSEGLSSPRNLLRKYSDEGTANAMLVMPNRAGTLSSTINLVKLAQSLDYTPVMSVRARETEDDAIVDIAVACGVPQLRCGGLQCSERNSKYDRLKLIEEILTPSTKYASDSLIQRVDPSVKSQSL
jgi:enolase